MRLLVGAALFLVSRPKADSQVLEYGGCLDTVTASSPFGPTECAYPNPLFGSFVYVFSWNHYSSAFGRCQSAQGIPYVEANRSQSGSCSSIWAISARQRLNYIQNPGWVYAETQSIGPTWPLGTIHYGFGFTGKYCNGQVESAPDDFWLC
jgi:hypothetical protein